MRQLSSLRDSPFYDVLARLRRAILKADAHICEQAGHECGQEDCNCPCHAADEWTDLPENEYPTFESTGIKE